MGREEDGVQEDLIKLAVVLLARERERTPKIARRSFLKSLKEM